MGFSHAFSLGEEVNQCVCLNKNDDMWEVYIIERGRTFEKESFEDCFDACIKVIFHLADSKQMWEKTKYNFMKKNLRLMK